MSGLSASLLTSFAAMAVVVIALLHLVYDLSSTRQRLRHRTDMLTANRRPRAILGNPAAPGVGPLQRFAATSLRGDALELARWLAPLRLAPRLLPYLLLFLRVIGTAVLGSILGTAAYRHFGSRAFASSIGVGALGAGIGWWLPHVLADRLARRRQRAIGRGLADAIELLVIAVEAGLSLEDAIGRVVVELWRAQPPMAEELAITAADLKILPNRDDALHRLAERVDLPSVHSVVTTLSQTMRYGTPLAQALRVVAAELRNDALLRLEEQANRLPVLLTVPMILFILPALFLIIGGPAFLRVLDVISR